MVSSRLFKQRVQNAISNHSYSGVAASTWFLGNLTKAVGYRKAWDVQTIPYGAGSPEEFNRDVVNQIKVTEMGHPYWFEPRLVCKNTA
jgi:hypothetical protein